MILLLCQNRLVHTKISITHTKKFKCNYCGNSDDTKLIVWYKTDIMSSICAICGQKFDNDIRLLNHMMEKHGWRNPNVDKPDRNSRGY